MYNNLVTTLREQLFTRRAMEIQRPVDYYDTNECLHGIDMNQRFFFLWVFVLSVSGCASWFEQPKQTVAIQAFAGTKPIDGVDCNLANDRGQWSVTAPGSVEVITSAEDLVVLCSQTQTNSGTANAVARVSPGYLKNRAAGVILPVGAASSVQQQTVGLQRLYPDTIRVVMGQSIIVTNAGPAP